MNIVVRKSQSTLKFQMDNKILTTICANLFTKYIKKFSNNNFNNSTIFYINFYAFFLFPGK